MNYRDRFRVKPGSAVRLSKIDPGFTDGYAHKRSARGDLADCEERMGELQYLLYAEGRQSLLICLQALDAGGKDGTITHVFGAMNPQGMRVHAFGVPSAEEARHDFLWRIHRRAPERGQVAIFNRSHYEDVLVARVHELVTKAVWSQRYQLINNFEKSLAHADTHILKFYLHISPTEQLRRFKDRLDDPARRWKISEADYKERELWPRYMKAYEEALRRTSTEHAPWFVIPADHKWFRNLAVSRIIVETLESLGMRTPAPRADMDEIRRRYHAARRHSSERA